MTWTVPNILTVARVLAAPFVALVFLFLPRPLADWVAFGLFAGAALTDYIDGWLARRWGQISEVGKMLDPIADKAMVIIALAVLTGLIGVRLWFVLPMAAILLREVLVSGLREYLGDVKLPVTKLAKWKTTVQMVAIGWLFLFLPQPPVLDMADPAAYVQAGVDIGLGGTAFGFALLWIAALLTLMTGWDYLRKGVAVLHAREKGRG